MFTAVKKPAQTQRNPKSFGAWLTVLNIILFSLSVFFLYATSVKQRAINAIIAENNQKITETTILVSSKSDQLDQQTSTSQTKSTIPKNTDGNSEELFTSLSSQCVDPLWCDVKMPKKSYYKFEPPTDKVRWKWAQLQASLGKQVLLERVLKVFPNHFDFIDGDISFRKLHYNFDFFIDERRDLSPLVKGSYVSTESADVITRKLSSSSSSLLSTTTSNYNNTFYQISRRLEDTKITAPKIINGKLLYPWEQENKRVIPDVYDFRAANRSPIVSIGYTAYTRDSQTYFSGNRIGGAFIDRNTFFKHWKAVKDKMDTSFLAICSLNENWGFLSTNFPNRTAGWGQCCTQDKDKDVHAFLNHPKTLMLATNQHVNLSHPKLLILPRGIPVTWGTTRILIWDTMRTTYQNLPKKTLLFATGSSWGPRPQILKCISKKVPMKYFTGHSDSPPAARYDRKQYYEKLGTAMFGVGLPGLGYDCFRTWELMTMGSIVILEKSVGFDRTMWRLPALLLEDFDEITEELLRVAYVEALYHADDFEYHRLTQSFWWSVIANVSIAKSYKPLVDLFPMEAEDPHFTRPRIPYDCGKTNTCGKGTKRTPKSSC